MDPEQVDGNNGGGNQAFWRGRDADVALREPTGGAVLTYAGLGDRVGLLAGQLAALGVGPGEVAAYSLPNGLETVLMFLAAVASGGAAAPLNPALTGEEVGRYLSDLRPRVLVVDGDAPAAALAGAGSAGVPVVALEGSAESLRLASGRSAQVPSPADADAVALLLHTSGTTGRPKIVPLRRRNLLASAHSIARHYALGPSDVSHCIMPLFHIHGLVGSTIATLVSGGSVITPRRFSAGAFWDDGRAFGASWFSAVPTIHQILVARAVADGGPPRHDLRFARSSSSPLLPPVLQAFESTFAIPLIEAYGMTEAAHQMASNPLPPGERIAGSVGVSAGAEIGVVDDAWQPLSHGASGEVVVRGAGVIDGYLNHPEANASSFRDGWFRTGDSGALDRHGYLRLGGRIKELINRGGEKISPHEVEDVLLRHAAVAEAVAYGAPDAKYGEVVAAAVVVRTPATQRALQEHCSTYLAEFKVPQRIAIVKAIPKGPTGKIQRRLLSELLGDP